MLRRAFSTAKLSKPYLWDKLPGEGVQPRKGVEKLMGSLRANRFSQPFPVNTTPKDRFDVAIGKRVCMCVCDG